MDCTPETGHFISPSLLYHWKKQYSRGKLDSEPIEEAVPQHFDRMLETSVSGNISKSSEKGNVSKRG